MTAPATSELGEPTICGGCGVHVETRKPACGTCQEPYAAEPTRARVQPDGAFWVAVRAKFTCTACRFDAPLNHFEVGEGVTCARCGIEQRFDRSSWNEILRFAHLVGDFGSGGPNGRFPNAELPVVLPGEVESIRTRGGWASRRAFRACPGNPLCPRCHAPWVWSSRTDGVLEVACSACSERRRYEIPELVGRFEGLVGVLADEHEADRKEVVVEEESGVSVLRCPNCAAPLESVADKDGVVECRYCHVPCRISTRTHARAGHRSTPQKTWWLLFDGPSAERRRRESDARQAKARGEKRRHKQEQRARPRTHAPAPVRPDPKRGAMRPEVKVLLPLLSVFGAAVIVGFVILQDRAPGAASSGDFADEGALRRFSFELSSTQTGELFGVPGKDDMTVRFGGAGVAKSVRIYRGAGAGPSYDITVQGGDGLDLDAALGRLRMVAPHRLTKAPNTYEVNVNRSLLRFDPRVMPQYRGSVQVSTWRRDDTAREIADAYWGIAEYVLYGGEPPGADALRLLNGPELSTLAKLDATVPIERAKDAFIAVVPFGECKTVTDIAASKTQMVCETDLDHPLLAEAHLAWPNGPGTRLEAISFRLGEADEEQHVESLVRCLDEALGPGEKIVTDHATGRSTRDWKVGAQGDHLTLDGRVLGLASPDGHVPTAPPEWTKKLPRLFEVLAHCGP